MKKKIRIAIIQMDVVEDKEKNLSNATRLIKKAALLKPDIICLPELFNYSGSFKKSKHAIEDSSGPSISLIRYLARKYKVHIVAGSILEKDGKNKPFNTCFFIGPTGSILSRYSKLHLFDINIPGRIKYNESAYMQAGSHVTVAKSPFGLVGFAICNDLRYPEVFRRMALAGSMIIFIPSAFTKFTGSKHWLSLTRVRAVENQCYIVAVNQSGKGDGNVEYFGTSVIIDPWGKILAKGPTRGNKVIYADIDLKATEVIRTQLPALKKIRNKYLIKRF